jgi:hypothetical protein
MKKLIIVMTVSAVVARFGAISLAHASVATHPASTLIVCTDKGNECGKKDAKKKNDRKRNPGRHREGDCDDDDEDDDGGCSTPTPTPSPTPVVVPSPTPDPFVP